MRITLSFIFFLGVSFAAFADPVEDKSSGTSGTATVDYAYAQKCYYSIDRNKKEDWDRCVQQFQEVVDRYPQSPQVAKSLFSVAKLLQEKYDFVQEPQVLERSFSVYNDFLHRFPSHTMADDALYNIAVMRFEKEGDGERAAVALQALMERYPQGDKFPLAQDYLKKLGTKGKTHAKDLSKLVVSEPVLTKETKAEEVPPVINLDPAIQEKNLVQIPNFPAEASVEMPVRNAPPAVPAAPDFAIRRVVIDPGHGGEDIGAVGRKGTKESVVALQIARKLAFELKNKLGVETYLTRTTNRSLSLDERNNFANRMKADLFISIHANANPSKKAGGIQTFYLDNANSEAAKRLAVRENKAHADKLDLSSQVLSALLQNANTEESRDLAKVVQQSLVGQLKSQYGGVQDLQIDSALFYVLVGAKCPSILIETSFITNPKEELRLRDSEYQWKVAEGIAKGVQSFVQNRQSVASSL